MIVWDNVDVILVNPRWIKP